jgi:hypothetical protein
MKKDDAFNALMPEAKRALHKKVVVRPRVATIATAI